jgi:hypothetical protein
MEEMEISERLRGIEERIRRHEEIKNSRIEHQ